MKKSPKNFAIWTALNSEFVYFFSSEPSYYGGSRQDHDQITEQKQFVNKHKISKLYGDCVSQSSILETINKIGIDWDSSSLPESDRVAEFQGTFCEAEYKDIVRGVLVLVDGTEIDYYAVCKLNMDQFKAMQAFFDA